MSILKLNFFGSGASTNRNSKSRTKNSTRKNPSKAVTTLMRVFGFSEAKKNFIVWVDYKGGISFSRSEM
jgi:hypothetical protein